MRIRATTDETLDLAALVPKRIAEWETLPANSDRARAFYEDQVFPLACERMRAVAESNPRAALAIVPVGTQPYSPILAVLANPADRVVLLHTTGSRDVARDVAAALREDGVTAIFLRPCGDGTEGTRIVEAVEACHHAAGAPPSRAVVVDITSGRKATAAVLGAVAAVRGFRQVYIEARPSSAHRTFMVDERYVPLVSVRAAIGADRRAEALVLLAEGAFEAAERAFRDAEQAGGGAPLDRAGRAAAAALARWTQLDFAGAAGRFRRAARAIPAGSHAEVHALLERAAEAARWIAEAGGTPGRHAAARLLLQLDRRGKLLTREGLIRQPVGRGLRGLEGAELRRHVGELARRLGLRRADEQVRDPFRLAARLAQLLRDEE